MVLESPFRQNLIVYFGISTCYQRLTYEALVKHFPGMKERYIKRYGNAYELPSPKANELTGIFQRICKDNGILSTPDECFGFMQELPDKYPQMSIFDL